MAAVELCLSGTYRGDRKKGSAIWGGKDVSPEASGNLLSVLREALNSTIEIAVNKQQKAPT